MSNVIDFLERMGQDAQLRHASRSEVELVLAGTPLDPELQAAILAKDQRQIEALLGQRNLCCMLAPAKEDQEEEEESPSREDEEMRRQSSVQIVALAG